MEKDRQAHRQSQAADVAAKLKALAEGAATIVNGQVQPTFAWCAPAALTRVSSPVEIVAAVATAVTTEETLNIVSANEKEEDDEKEYAEEKNKEKEEENEEVAMSVVQRRLRLAGLEAVARARETERAASLCDCSGEAAAGAFSEELAPQATAASRFTASAKKLRFSSIAFLVY